MGGQTSACLDSAQSLHIAKCSQKKRNLVGLKDPVSWCVSRPRSRLDHVSSESRAEPCRGSRTPMRQEAGGQALEIPALGGGKRGNCTVGPGASTGEWRACGEHPRGDGSRPELRPAQRCGGASGSPGAGDSRSRAWLAAEPSLTSRPPRSYGQLPGSCFPSAERRVVPSHGPSATNTLARHPDASAGPPAAPQAGVKSAHNLPTRWARNAHRLCAPTQEGGEPKPQTSPGGRQPRPELSGHGSF